MRLAWNFGLRWRLSENPGGGWRGVLFFWDKKYDTLKEIAELKEADVHTASHWIKRVWTLLDTAIYLISKLVTEPPVMGELSHGGKWDPGSGYN